MIADLKPYAEYKESGLPWLGQVPRHWEVSRLKGRLTRNDAGVWSDKFSDNGTTVLRSTEQTVDGGWKLNAPAKILLSASQVASATLAVGDLLVTKSSGSPLHIGKTSLVNSEIADLGCCFSNFMQRLRVNTATDPQFAWRLLNSAIGREQFVFQTTTTTGLGNLNGTILANCWFPFPPLDEQAAIVRFLDWANGRLERAIRAKRKVIALLGEQKQAIIHRAVTRGLDPSVPLKPSGIPWLRDIPQHWEVRRLKHLAQFQSGDGITSLQIEPAGPFPVYGGNGLRGFSTRYTHEGHYALIGRQGALCGNINFAEGQFFASEHAVVPTLRSEMAVVWFGELLRLMNLNQYSQSAAQPGLAVERIKNLYAPVPPAGEQHEIVEQLESSTLPLNTTISRLEREIELLREYRTRLVADVVTGKLDVREAALRLPDDAPLETIEDDANLNTDAEATDEEAAV